MNTNTYSYSYVCECDYVAAHCAVHYVRVHNASRPNPVRFMKPVRTESEFRAARAPRLAHCAPVRPPIKRGARNAARLRRQLSTRLRQRQRLRLGSSAFIALRYSWALEVQLLNSPHQKLRSTVSNSRWRTDKAACTRQRAAWKNATFGAARKGTALAAQSVR